MEVRDLGDLDGMLFDLGSERQVAFTMRNTLIPLTIYFFDEAGSGVGRLEMVPCEAEPCPTYSIDAPRPLRLGGSGWIGRPGGASLPRAPLSLSAMTRSRLQSRGSDTGLFAQPVPLHPCSICSRRVGPSRTDVHRR